MLNKVVSLSIPHAHLHQRKMRLVINELLETVETSSKAVVIEPVHRGLPGLTHFGDRSFHSSLSRTARLYPHLHNTVGFFIAKLRVR